MTRTLRVVLVAAVTALVTAVVAAPAGAGDAGAVEITGIDLDDFPTVALEVAATGDAAEALEAGEVTVAEDGEDHPAEVTARSSEVVDVALAIDVSGSMEGDPLDQAKAAARTFVTELPGAADVAVISFGDSATLVSPLTADRDATLAAIGGLSAGGETALYDAIALAAGEVAIADSARTGVVVLSDGADNVSTDDLATTVGTLDNTDTEFFAVSLRSPETDQAALQQLAEGAGGRVISADDPEALTGAYRDLSQRLVERYEVTYTSTASTPTVDLTVGAGGAEVGTELTVPSSAVDDTPTERAAPEPRVVELEPAPVATNTALWAGIGMIALAAATVVAIILGGERRTRRPRRSLRSDAGDRRDADTSSLRTALDTIRERASQLSARAVERAEKSRMIDASLDRAGLAMRSGEFVATVAGTAAVAGGVLWLLVGTPGLLIGAALAVGGAPALLKQLARRRNKAFANQLGDALMLLAGSMRAGMSLGQAMDNLADESDPPMEIELQRALLEARLGRSIEDGLRGVAARMDSKDLAWVADAVGVHREVGGDLTRLLEQVADKIRVRGQTLRKIDALTAEGRMSALVLSILPVGMAAIMYVTNPDYLTPLFSSGTGLVMLAVGVGLLGAGVVWLKSLISVGGT